MREVECQIGAGEREGDVGRGGVLAQGNHQRQALSRQGQDGLTEVSHASSTFGKRSRSVRIRSSTCHSVSPTPPECQRTDGGKGEGGGKRD